MNRQTQPPAATRHNLSSLNEVLAAQIDALARIEAILAEERRALEERTPEELLAAAESKTHALAALGDLEQQRKALSADFDSGQVAELRELTARCRSMNQQNSALLSAQQAHVNRLLALLRGSADAGPTSYDASGRTTPSGSKQLRLTEV